MMRFMMSACLAGLIVAAPVPGQSHVEGQLKINPPHTGPIAVFLKVLRVDTGEEIDEQRVNPSSPWRFKIPVPANVQLKVAVTVESPAGYVPVQAELTKEACCPLVRDIRIKRPADIYAENLVRGQDRNLDTDKRLAALIVAGLMADEAEQRLEVSRSLGNLYRAEAEFALQDSVLAGFQPELANSEVSDNKRRIFWEERLDGILEWANYRTDIGFGALIADSTNPAISEAWQRYLTQFRTAYPTVPLDLETRSPEAIAGQLKVVEGVVRGGAN